MRVLLKEDVDNLGYAGEVYKVADGYGRNYLIPKGMAVVATPSMMKQAEAWRKKAEARRAEQRAEFEALAAQIEGVRLVFTARAGDSGKLYGSITTSQIADALNEELGTEIDRRKVGVEPLRQLGEHNVVVRLSGEFQPEMTVVIESEDGEEVIMEEPVMMEEVVVEEVIEEDVLEEDGEIVAEEEETAVLEVEEVTEA
ncbi:MAG TPA: 50S ribosomal protein L9 [Chromatiaceae bacterium]|nr:50S ribosomal protein L9 [Chloroflexota bacterium]HIE55521.1 50S ribosomal protein L9 [Chromatiaceae bacterium]HIP72049.1 50S ribosomal protein L9 [Anaerolineae bacterium]